MNSPTMTKIAPAICAAQTQIKHAVKDSSNPFFKSKYADLDSVWDAVEEALKGNSLSVVQLPCEIGGNAGLSTMILHSSGEYIQESVPLILAKQDPQGVGSSITYMRRYALAAALGVRTCDDDAERAMGRTHAESLPVTRQTANPAIRHDLSSDQQPKPKGPQRQAADEGAGSSDWPEIVVETVTEKTGEGAKGPWTKFGVKGSDGKWYSTFDTKIGELAKRLKGQKAFISYRQNAKNAAFNDLLEIRPCAAPMGEDLDIPVESIPF